MTPEEAATLRFGDKVRFLRTPEGCMINRVGKIGTVKGNDYTNHLPLYIEGEFPPCWAAPQDVERVTQDYTRDCAQGHKLRNGAEYEQFAERDGIIYGRVYAEKHWRPITHDKETGKAYGFTIGIYDLVDVKREPIKKRVYCNVYEHGGPGTWYETRMAATQRGADTNAARIAVPFDLIEVTEE